MSQKARKIRGDGMLLAVDFDDVLVDSGIVRELLKEYGLSLSAHRSFDLTWAPRELRDEAFRRFRSPRYNRDPRILPGAVETISELSAAGFKLVVVTARVEEIRGVTEKVIAANFPTISKLIMTGGAEKGAIVKKMGAAALLDDSVSNIESALVSGVAGLLVTSDETPWNHKARERKDIRIIHGIEGVWSVAHELRAPSKDIG